MSRHLRPILAVLAAAIMLVCLEASAQQPIESLPGFKADQLFDGSGIDNVNVYSGDVQLSVPLGPEYALGSGLTWRLMANYSNHIWNQYRQRSCEDPQEPCLRQPAVQHAVLAGRSTLGAGWVLDVGYITGDVNADWEGSTHGPTYHSPDGSTHVLVTSGGGLYRPDDSFVARFRHYLPPNEKWSMELPDGSTRWFEHVTAPPPMPNDWDFYDGPYVGASETKQFGLTRIEDPVDSTKNLLEVSYVSASSWQIDYVMMGTRRIDFTWGTFVTEAIPELIPPEPSHTWPVLTSVSLPAAQGQSLNVTFGREDRILWRSAFASGGSLACQISAAPMRLRAPFLATINVGDNVYDFSYADVLSAGKVVLHQVQLPTGGTISYGYGTDLMRNPCRHAAGGCPSVEDHDPALTNNVPEPEPNCSFDVARAYMDTNSAVEQRTEVDPVAGTSALTTYHRRNIYEPENPNSYKPDMNRVVRVVTVERPNGNQGRFTTKHFFVVNVSGGPTGMELERRIYSGTNVGSGVSPVRSVVRCYDSNGPFGIEVVCGVTEAAQGPPSTDTMIPDLVIFDATRLRREVTWYGVNPLNGGSCDDTTAATVACWARESDGWVQAAREFGQETFRIPRSGPSIVFLQEGQWGRRTTTNWTPSDSPRWLPKLFDSRTVADLYDDGAPPNEPASITTSYSFNTSNGKLLSTSVADGGSTLTRQLGYGSPEGPDPVLETLELETPISGGGSTVDSYDTTRTYQRGQVLTERRTAPSDVGWDQFHVTRDGSTDAVTASSDPSGIATTFTWDALGRLTGISPTDEAATEICHLPWSANAPTVGARVLVKRKLPTGCSTSLSAPTIDSGTAEAYVFDGFGRLVREIRLRPTLNSGSYMAVRVTTRNDAGLVSSSSEWTACGSGSDLSTCFLSGSSLVTTFEGFDVLGRPTTIHLPDRTHAPATDTRRVEKKYDDPDTTTPYTVPMSDFREDTIRYGTSSGTTWQAVRRDLFGRVIASTEPANSAPFGPVSYADWNVLDKLVTYRGARTTPEGEVTQTRTWAYNRFGFLTSESSPEAGTTTYGSFTALGSPQTKVVQGDGTTTITLTSEFDPLGRLKRTFDGVEKLPEKKLLENAYDEATDADGNSLGSSKGKLTTATNWNRYPSSPPSLQWNGFYPGGFISDVFTYSGRGGRLAKKRSTLSNGTVSTIGSWTYNNLGLVEDETHPRIDPNHSPLVVTTKYTAGLPTKVSVGSQLIASSVTYNPAGGLASYTSGNNYKTTIAPDDHGMPRLKSIKTDDTDPVTGPIFETGNFAYDGAGNIISMGPDLFTYDAASRLLSATYGSRQDYAYDGWGNLTSKAGTAIAVNAGTNRLTAATYDFRGNVAVLGAEAYSYDSLGRQVRNDNDTSGRHFSYLLDAANERITKSSPPVPTATNVLRRDMARIILQALEIAPLKDYQGTFADVPATDPERGWIEKFFETEFTAGCGEAPARFCPDNLLSRAEMSVFLSLAMTYPSFDVPDSGWVGTNEYVCSNLNRSDWKSLFSDVPPNHWACKFIHYIYAGDVTAGCGGGAFCPNGTVDNWQMEIFMSSVKPGFLFVPAGSTYSFRGPNGSVLTEFQDSSALRSRGYVSKDFVFLGNRLVGTKDASAGWMFHATDHLGSVRLTMTGAGNTSRKYWPWGEETASEPAFTLGFAGMERDAETDFDRPRYYDHARSIETGYGRFLSPDMLSGDVEDPLSWNRYTYARNNPLKYVDPDGRDPKDTNLTLRVVINRGVVGSDMQDRIGEQIQHASGFFGERGIELDTKTYFGSFDGDEAFRSLDFDGRVRVGTGTSPIESLPNGPGSGSILAGFTNGSFMGRADVNRGRLLVGNRSNGFSLTHELIHIFLDRGVKQTTSSYLGREMVREPMLRLLRFFQNQKLQDGAKLYRKAESSCSDPKFVGPCK